MIIKIVCAGIDHFGALYRKEEDEYLIGVDGGARAIIRNKVPLNLAIGDFDSGDYHYIAKRAQKIVVYSTEKDESDLELALKYISTPEFRKEVPNARYIEKVIVYNATGRRLDHYHSNIALLTRYTHLPIEIVDLNNRIFLVNSKTSFNRYDVKLAGYKFVSFFALEPNTVISLTGFKYNVTDRYLQPFDTYGLSNEIVSDRAWLMTNNKKILVFFSK